MKYVYPALFTPFDDNEDGYCVEFPDIPGCLTEGFSLDEAIAMAHSALREMLQYYEDNKLPIDKASRISDVHADSERGQFTSLISVETKDHTVVKKTVSLQKWMVSQAEERHISLSRVLQNALAEQLNA